MQTARAIEMNEQTERKEIKSKHPGGAPTKYGKHIIDKAKHYLEHYEDIYGDVIPSVVGLSQVIDISKVTLYEWAKHKDKKELSNMLKLIVESQERKLLNGGLNSTFNANITKLVLSKHGYTDKVVQGNQGITVNVSRGRVEVVSGGDTLTIDTDTGDEVEYSGGDTLEHGEE